MNNPPKEFIESSFLRPLLEKEGVTDISYNGADIYYVTNEGGRFLYEKNFPKKEVGDFLRQLANLTEKQFSFANPILDVSFGRYRLNATFMSLARYKNEKTYTFSLRLASEKCAIDDNDGFFGKEAEEILIKAVRSEESIVIGGLTGTGKTELEKWLLSKANLNSRIIVIDNVEELDMVVNDNVDLTTWISNENYPQASFSSLIKNSLRNNPDYVIVAEARGKEMLDALTSVMSGHPIITSIHSKDLESMPERMARLCMLSEQKLYIDALLSDIAHHFKYFVYLEKETVDGSVIRYVSSIGIMNPKTQQIEVVYERSKK